MKFYTTNATGDSGLFFLGFWINQNFGFPFRIMSADIGIDAEIELTDNDLHSKGLIVKGQVKSTQTLLQGNFYEYIELKHLDYWNKLIVPVIYFKIDLSCDKIYYKIISSMDDIEKTKENNEEKWKINFNTETDLLKVETKRIWIEKFNLVEFHNISVYFEAATKIMDGIITSVLDNESYHQELRKIQETEEIIKRLNSLQNLYPWKFGDRLINRMTAMTNRLSSLDRELDYHRTHINHY